MNKTAFEVAAAQPWAIKASALEQILTIAAGYGEGPDALAARMGRPLQNTREVTVHGDGVAVVPISGPIFHRANLFTQISGATSTEILALDFMRALDDPSINAIVLDIGSPGGQVAGISEMAQMINAGNDIKPVVAYVNSIGASGAYWLAAAADKIVVNDTAMTGSIGVVMSASTRKNDNRIEIVSSNAPKKRIDAGTDAGRDEIQSLVDRLEVEFISSIAQYRGVTVDFVKENFGSGGLIVGSDAIAAGMADDVGTLEGVIAGLSGQQTGAFNMPTTKAAGNNQPAITIDLIKAEHPDIAEALRSEGIAEVTPKHAQALLDEGAAAAEAERNRIKAVYEQGAKIPGHESLIAGLMFDGKTTGPEAAVAILGAESAARASTLQDIKNGAPKPAAPTPEPAQPDAAGDFWALVDAEVEAGASRGAAIRKVTQQHPQAHQAMIANANHGAIN